MNNQKNALYILRCCRDWPVHLIEGAHMGGRCGICGKPPDFILKEYRGPHGYDGEDGIV